ncbi:hypothetical protein GX586_05385 [bacterium]|nr:hypothetical protein [bacterium]
MKRTILAITAAACTLMLAGALAYKVYWSEQARLYWNHPLHFFDGRHTLAGDAGAVTFDLSGELWVRDRRSGTFIRLVPDAGIELSGEQGVSLSSSRQGRRVMYKLRPQFAADAAPDWKDAAWAPSSNDYYLYFEQRAYSNDAVLSYYKDCRYGPGGLFFVDPATGAHIAGSNYSTLYVPSPDAPAAGPSNWLWAAAANRAFVEAAVTGGAARAAWDQTYWRRVQPPARRTAPGEPGDLATDGTFIYLYSSSGWLRFKADSVW